MISALNTTASDINFSVVEQIVNYSCLPSNRGAERSIQVEW